MMLAPVAIAVQHGAGPAPDRIIRAARVRSKRRGNQHVGISREARMNSVKPLLEDVTHVGIVVRDLKSALRHYTETLGLGP